MSQIEAIIKNYRALAQIPTILSAKLMSNDLIVNSVWSRRNLELGKNTKSFISYNINADLNLVTENVALDVSNELMTKISPSGKYRAIIRECETKDGPKQFLEIWKQAVMTNCVDLAAADVHLDVYTDGEFGSFEWSPNEIKLMYIAEKKNPKSEAFYKRKPNNEKKDIVQGQEYVYRQDWGEQLTGKKQSVVVLYDILKDDIQVLDGIPNDVCPAQVIWGSDNTHIFGIALKTNPRKLGLIYCTNRLSTIFSLDLQGNYVSINLKNKSVKSPTLTENGKDLVWLQRDAGGPHASAMSLVKTTLPISETSPIKAIVDIIDTEIPVSCNKEFYGLYNAKFPNRCWASDRRILLSTNQKNTINSYAIDIDTGSITELPFENGSQIILDCYHDTVLVSQRNFLKSDQLAIGKLPPKGNEMTIEWKNIAGGNEIDGLSDSVYHYLDIKQNDSEEVSEFSAIYLGPKSAPAQSVPLIVWPHGGPHSAFANGYSIEASMFLKTGYGILLINYRGSIGAGEKSVKYLLGRVGKSDVYDCVLATNEATKKFPCLNPNQLILVGGSHGGFLVTHLSGQYPEMFKAVIARNPVIDIASMSIVSDIPDWCFVEAGIEYSQVGELNMDILQAMRKASPIYHAHKVKAPTLLQVGSKDLRVPPSQAVEYYHRLKANNIPVEMNLYEDNHPLGLVPVEMDNLINTLLFISKHVQ